MIIGSSSSSPIIKPSDPSNFPENQRPHGKQRSDSVRGDEDYFISGPRFSAGNSASAPTSPASAAKYNVSFSPRITFHDTWPSGEYDRRGEIATCNRLTPMLAQQIKEELNTFKMVSLIILVPDNVRKRANNLSRKWLFMRSPKFIRIFSNDPIRTRRLKRAFIFRGSTIIFFRRL